MAEGLYVSDVFNIDEEVRMHGNKIFLIAGVGSGKSTWVKDVLTKQGSVLFITSRKAKVEEDVNCSCFSELFRWYTNGNQTLITNAKLSKMVEMITNEWLKDLDEFIDHFDYIVIDEVHSIVTDSTFAESCYGLFSFMEYVAEKGKTVVAMTGTPEPIYRYFIENNWYILDYRKKCVYVHPEKIVITTKRDAISKIRGNWGSKKLIYFVNNTDTIVSISEILLKDSDIFADEISACVSRAKDKEFRDKLDILGKEKSEAIIKASKETYTSIIIENKIPDNCKILFSTSTLREGIDIINDNMIMFCENHILSNLIQFFGRARSEGCHVYVIEDSADHPVEQDPLLYNYAVAEEANAGNQFLKKEIEVEGNAFVEQEKKDLIKHVKKNPYIFFDYILDEFRVFHLRFKEESRLKKNKYWKTELAEYCDLYSIPLIDPHLKETMQEALRRMAEKELKVYKENKSIILNVLQKAYGVSNTQPSKINEKLQELDVPVRIITGKDNGGERRNDSYWKAVWVETAEYRKWQEKEDRKKEKNKTIKLYKQ